MCSSGVWVHIADRTSTGVRVQRSTPNNYRGSATTYNMFGLVFLLLSTSTTALMLLGPTLQGFEPGSGSAHH